MKKKLSILTALCMLLSLGLSLLPAGTAQAADATLIVSANNTTINITWDSGKWKAVATGGTADTQYFGTSDTLTITGASSSTEYTGCDVRANATGAPTDAACNVTFENIKMQAGSSGHIFFASKFTTSQKINLGLNSAQLSTRNYGITTEEQLMPLTITTTGTNSIKNDGAQFGVRTDGPLTFNGTGTLSVEGGIGISGQPAIVVGGLLTVESGTLTAIGGDGDTGGGNTCHGGSGIHASKLNILAGASVTATGGNAGMSTSQNFGGYGVACNNISLAGSLKAIGGEKSSSTNSESGGAFSSGAVVTLTDAAAVLEVQNGTDNTETFTAKRDDALKDSHQFKLAGGTTISGVRTDQQTTVTPPDNALGKVTLMKQPADVTLAVNGNDTTVNISWDTDETCWKAVATGGTTDTLLFGTNDTLTIAGKNSSTEYTGCDVQASGIGAPTGAVCNVTYKDIKMQAGNSGYSFLASNFTTNQKINLGLDNAQLSTLNYGIAINMKTPLTITTTGTSSVKNVGNYVGIDSQGSITFNGTGALRVEGATNATGQRAISTSTSGTVTVESGTLEAIGGNGNGTISACYGGNGIYTNELNILADASVTAAGGNAGASDTLNVGGRGIHCNNISLAGNLKAVGGEKGIDAYSVGGSAIIAGTVVTFTDADAVLEVQNGTDSNETFIAKRNDALKDFRLFKLENGATTADAPTDQQITVTPPDNTLGKVTVKNVQYTLTASAGANGSINPSGAVKVDHGDSQTFTFTPNSGYEMDKVTVDGTAVTVSGNSHTVNNVTADGSINVTFKKQEEKQDNPPQEDDKEIKKPYYANIKDWANENGQWTATDEFGDKILGNWGWDESKQTWHYFNSDGSMKKSGWVKTKDRYGKYHWYYLLQSGIMATDWEKIDGEWYYFDIPDGNMRTGWIQLKGKWYWLRKNGTMATGYEQVNKRWSRFSSSGVWQGYAKNTGWKKYSKGWSFKANNSWVKNKWLQINGKWYAFDNAGYMRTGWVKSGGKWYYLKSSGAMAANEWKKSGKSWYWLKANGSMAANESVTINGVLNSFDKNGTLVKEK